MKVKILPLFLLLFSVFPIKGARAEAELKIERSESAIIYEINDKNEAFEKKEDKIRENPIEVLKNLKILIDWRKQYGEGQVDNCR